MKRKLLTLIFVFILVFTIVPFVVSNNLGEGATFFEGFESGSLATYNWTNSGAGTAWFISTDDPYGGTNLIEADDTNGESIIETTVSTITYENITLSFYYDTDGLDTGEYFAADWYNGTGWTNILNIEDTVGWTNYNSTLPSSAWNNSNFKIRFRCSSGGPNEECKVDNVNITGITHDTTPPSSVTNLANQSAGRTWLYWNWTAPSDYDFYQAIVYINGIWKINTPNNFYNATGLSYGTTYTITVHTKDLAANLNSSDVNNTASTLPNNLPTHSTPILNSTTEKRLTRENLTCYNQSTSDLDGNPVKNIYNWYENGTSIMILNMPFEMNHTSENITKDYSPYENNGTVNGSTWNPTGGYDGKGAYSFDGSNDYINLGDKFEDVAQGTIIFWINAVDTASDQRIAGKDDNFETRVSAAGKIEVDLGGFKTLASSVVIDPDRWYHVAITWDSTSQELFIDTASESTGLGYTPADTAYSFLIGRGGQMGTTFNGIIDEFMIFNRSLSLQQIIALYENKTDIIVSQETIRKEIWKCSVTPNDGYDDGATLFSNNITVRNTPPTINFNASVPASPIENEAVYLYANVTDPDNDTILWVNFTVIAPNGSIILDHENASSSLGDIWNSSTFTASDVGTWLWNITASDGDNSSTTLGRFIVPAWYYIVGNVSGELVLSDSSGTRVLDWDVTNLSGSNLYIADSDSTISFNNLKAFSRNLSGTYFSDDFEELDTLTNMTGLIDSVNITYTANSNPKATETFTIFGVAIDNVPIINSTNSSNFISGILWDSNDDIGDGQFDLTDKEDIVFVTKVNPSTPGRYGTYDFEATIPAKLRRYITDSLTTVSVYTEIR